MSCADGLDGLVARGEDREDLIQSDDLDQLREHLLELGCRGEVDLPTHRERPVLGVDRLLGMATISLIGDVPGATAIQGPIEEAVLDLLE